MTICCIEELFLSRDINDGESLIEFIKIPYFIEIVLLFFLLAAKFIPEYTMVNSNGIGFSEILIAISVAVGAIRGYFRYIKIDGLEIGAVVTIGFTIVIYLCIFAQFISVLDVQLDRNPPQVIEAKVLAKGYINDDAANPRCLIDTERHMAIRVKTEEYGKFTVDITQNDYESIEVGETVDVNIGRGLLGIKYLYYPETKLGYPLIKSIFGDKEFRRYLKDKKELEYVGISEKG